MEALVPTAILLLGIGLIVFVLRKAFYLGRAEEKKRSQEHTDALEKHYTGILWVCGQIRASRDENSRPYLLITLDRGGNERITIQCYGGYGDKIKVTNFVKIRIRSARDKNIETRCEPFGDMFIPELSKPPEPKAA